MTRHVVRCSLAAALILLTSAANFPGVAAADPTASERGRATGQGGGGAVSLKGRSLFLKNCAHCHGDDAKGDEGPDLHGLRKSDAWIEKRIRNGIKGEMPAFREKFQADDIAAIISFLRTLE